MMTQSYDAATGEDQRLSSVLQNQDAIVAKYSTYGAQFQDAELRHDILEILDDEREILGDLFGVMRRRGLQTNEPGELG